MGTRLSTGLISLTAVGNGDGVVIGATGFTAWTLSLLKRAIIRKIMWRNRTGGNGNLLIGYGDRTVAGSVFRQVFPSIWMVNGFDGELTEDEIPMAGGISTGVMHEGFCADTTPVTGTVGNIIVETDCALVAAAPLNVQVLMEIEEI